MQDICHSNVTLIYRTKHCKVAGKESERLGFDCTQLNCPDSLRGGEETLEGPRWGCGLEGPSFYMHRGEKDQGVRR